MMRAKDERYKNPETGNISDEVSRAWEAYGKAGGLLSPLEWHAKMAPLHPPCSMCRDATERRGGRDG